MSDRSCCLHMFGDDTNISLSRKTLDTTLLGAAEAYAFVSVWLYSNCLEVNNEQNECVILSTAQDKTKLSSTLKCTEVYQLM